MDENNTQALGQEQDDVDVKEEVQRRKAEAEKSKFAEELLQKAEMQLEHHKLLDQAEKEMEGVGNHGTVEQILLMIGAALLILALPFLGYVNGFFLTLFTAAVSLIAGITSPKKSYSPGLNLIVSVIGLLYFEYGAIIQFHSYGITNLFLLYQALAFDFLFATYFSMVTYRRKVLGG
jgi:hypothetical protein